MKKKQKKMKKKKMDDMNRLTHKSECGKDTRIPLATVEVNNIVIILVKKIP